MWVPGELTVTASWEKDGDTKTARPYTAVLAAGETVTSVTLTLDDMDMDGDFGIWKPVVWDEPAGGE